MSLRQFGLDFTKAILCFFIAQLLALIRSYLYNVFNVSATEVISDGPEGILLESLLEGMAEYYSADLSEKVMRGQTEIAREELLQPPEFKRDQFLFWFERMRKYDTTKLVHRRRLIDSFVNAIYLYDDRITLVFNFKDGTKTITFAELEESGLGSDINALAAINPLQLPRS